MEWWIGLLRLLIAAALGFLIGLERKIRVKEAGIRTHAMVSLGAALIMEVSKYGFADMGAEYPDYSRIAAQIVSGIGFLGAGIIIYNRGALRGLTTAAGIWTTAGVGMAAGAGMYILAAGATLIIVAVQCVMHLPFRLFTAKTYRQMKVVFVCTEGEDGRVRELFGVKRFSKLSISRQGEETLCTAHILTEKCFSDTFVRQIVRDTPFSRSVERSDYE